jgi:drug/metabolite transporter (DMT)-like permease
VSRRATAELALVGNTLVWGATFLLVKSALGDISALLFLALRFSLATAALALLFRKPLAAPQGRKGWRAGVLVGTFLFLGYLFQTMGLRFTSAPKSAFITGLTSVMVPLLGSFVYRIRPRLSEWCGILTAIVGLGLMTLPAAGLPGAALPGSIGAVNRGDILTFFCTIAFGAHIVTLGHYSKRMGFELLSVAQVGTAAVLSLALCIAGSLAAGSSGLRTWAESPYVEWRPAVVSAILITGLFATALAFTVQAWAQKYTTHTRTALIYMLEPVVAWATSYLLAGEGLTRRAAAGAALILGGVLLVELKPFNQR